MHYYGQTEISGHKAKSPKVGVILMNLGTPEAPTAQALRTYLREFLSDPRVIEVPKLLWWCILHGIILRVRPKKSAALYKSIWTEDGSPLMAISQAQTQQLQQQLKDNGFDAEVTLAMRYGQPSVETGLKTLQSAGVNKVVVLPLYPQYAGATTGSTFDALGKALSYFRWVPQLHFINTYHDHPLYIAALASSMREHVARHGEPDQWVLSYHGMPQRYFDQGDPYYCFCQKTTRLVKEALALKEGQVVTTFQSRFGREPWLRPYTDETLKRLPTQGVKHVAVVCPGFSADCLETLEEIAVENQHTFMQAGGETYHYVPALNDRADHIQLLMALVRPYLAQR